MTKQIIKSNTGSLGPLPDSDTVSRDLPITSVTLETKDLREAAAYLSFTCHVNLPKNTNANLIFIIKKYSDKGAVHEIGGSYVFSGVSEDTIVSKMFSFQFIDKDIHPGKFTYSIQLASNSISSCNSGTTITNATLNVIALGNDKDKKDGKGGKGSNSSSGNSSSSNSDNESNSNSDDSNTNASDANAQDASAQSNENVTVQESSNSENESDKKDSKEKNKKDDKKDNKKKDCKNKKDK